ncbi:MAG: hypothetical protein M3328_17335, partial [Chloroflexota bacterium]|nr:hypothetical protein [Chloroflexota bacterium]
PIQQLTVSNPGQIAVMPGGKYAFVTQQNGSAVSLIAYGRSAQNCRVVEQSIKVGSKPAGVTVTLENGQAMVANSGDSSLSVLTLAAYEAVTQPVTVGNLPTNVAASPDGRTVLAWNNALRTISGQSGSPSPGLYAYDTGSGTVTQQLSQAKIADCVFDQNPAKRQAYAVLAQTPQVSIVNTTASPFTVQTVALSANGQTRNPILVDASSDGSRLFVVAEAGALSYRMIVFDSSKAGLTLLQDIALYTASGKGFLAMCVAPDGSQAFVTNSFDHNLCVVQADKNGSYAAQTPISLTGNPTSLTVLPDGSKVYVLSTTTSDTMISVLDTQTLTLRTAHFGQQTWNASLMDITPSPDGTRLFATDVAQTAIRVIDPQSLRFVQTLAWGSQQVVQPYSIAILPDGSRIFTANVSSGNIGIVQQVQPAS